MQFAKQGQKTQDRSVTVKMTAMPWKGGNIMSKTALSVFLKRQLTFHSASLQQALQHSEQGGGELVDSLLEMQLLTQELY